MSSEHVSSRGAFFVIGGFDSDCITDANAPWCAACETIHDAMRDYHDDIRDDVFTGRILPYGGILRDMIDLAPVPLNLAPPSHVRVNMKQLIESALRGWHSTSRAWLSISYQLQYRTAWYMREDTDPATVRQLIAVRAKHKGGNTFTRKCAWCIYGKEALRELRAEVSDARDSGELAKRDMLLRVIAEVWHIYAVRDYTTDGEVRRRRRCGHRWWAMRAQMPVSMHAYSASLALHDTSNETRCMYREVTKWMHRFVVFGQQWLDWEKESKFMEVITVLRLGVPHGLQYRQYIRQLKKCVKQSTTARRCVAACVLLRRMRVSHGLPHRSECEAWHEVLRAGDDADLSQLLWDTTSTSDAQIAVTMLQSLAECVVHAIDNTNWATRDPEAWSAWRVRVLGADWRGPAPAKRRNAHVDIGYGYRISLNELRRSYHIPLSIGLNGRLAVRACERALGIGKEESRQSLASMASQPFCHGMLRNMMRDGIGFLLRDYFLEVGTNPWKTKTCEYRDGEYPPVRAPINPEDTVFFPSKEAGCANRKCYYPRSIACIVVRSMRKRTLEFAVPRIMDYYHAKVLSASRYILHSDIGRALLGIMGRQHMGLVVALMMRGNPLALGVMRDRNARCTDVVVKLMKLARRLVIVRTAVEFSNAAAGVEVVGRVPTSVWAVMLSYCVPGETTKSRGAREFAVLANKHNNGKVGKMAYSKHLVKTMGVDPGFVKSLVGICRTVLEYSEFHWMKTPKPVYDAHMAASKHDIPTRSMIVACPRCKSLSTMVSRPIGMRDYAHAGRPLVEDEQRDFSRTSAIGLRGVRACIATSAMLCAVCNTRVINEELRGRLAYVFGRCITICGGSGCAQPLEVDKNTTVFTETGALCLRCSRNVTTALRHTRDAARVGRGSKRNTKKRERSVDVDKCDSARVAAVVRKLKRKTSARTHTVTSMIDGSSLV